MFGIEREDKMKRIKLIGLLLIVFISSFVFDQQVVQGASSPYDVESSVRNGWSNTLGLKNFPQTSGKRLVYDVYGSKYTSGGYRIVNKNFGQGTKQYVNFQGWAVLQGHKRHTSSNHETYIVARKVVGLSGVGTTKVYGTLPYGNLSATEDLEYNNKGSGVWNECSASATNKDNEEDCNMRYDNVGFNAFIPLDDLFPDEDESASWTLFIVKRVDSHIVYTPLNIPFQFSDRAFAKGEISLTSGVNASTLQMNATGVLRRKYPRQLPVEVWNELGADRYFTTNKYYTRIDSDETETAVWYGVRSPEDGNSKRWANTAYWTFGGEQALLSYRTDYTPPPNGSCPKPVKPAPRYKYEFDFEVTKVDGKTVQKNTNTDTQVDVKRKSFATERNQAKTAIQNDINSRKSKKTQLTNELNTLKSQEAKIEKDLENAEKTDDYAKINQLMRDLQAKKQEIANKECHINSVQQEIDHYQKELDDLKAKETSNYSMSSPVVVKFNNSQQGSAKSVALMENETKSLTFTWKLTKDGTVTADINPNRQAVSGLVEETYSNNVRSTPIYVITNYTPNACAGPNGTSYAEGVVRTINSATQGQQILKEKLYTTLSMPNEHKTRRAGFGFEFTISNHYINEDSTSNGVGPTVSKTYMPNIVNYLPYSQKTWNSPSNSLKITGYEVPLQNTSTTGNQRDQVKKWMLPTYYVEEFSGNVFVNTSHPQRNSDDKLLNGGRKWYLNFEQPDGAYNFTSLAQDAGINKLNTCITGTVTVDGSIIGDPDGNDDFVKRSVTPDNPFPSGIGWNWKGKDSQITSLNDWYSNWYQEPNQIPFNSYKETFYLTPETLEEIREYSESVNFKFELGKSIFDSINIPNTE
ncbi:hypothetical protein HUN92_13590 [Bacillus firmus]|uniref:hypothetical protein n=1 Tax=Cytobacillus firmus TaxID=1399 RepID=UPI00157FE89E|nr:hypothetical protein [Cytobacillus firmus]NUH84753.1 hypothetical protein [Cytobacillus firmus]